MTSQDTRNRRIRSAMRLAASDIPVLKVQQRQDSETEQLYDLWMVATKLGMYDAADWLWKNAELEKEA